MKVLLVVLIFFISPFVRAQSTKVTDSLTTVLRNNKLSPTDRIETLNALAGALIRNNNKQAKIFTQQALNESRKLNYKKGEGWAMLNLAKIDQFTGELDSALMYIDKGLAIKEVNTDPSFIGKCMVAQGNIYRRKQNQEQSIQSFLKGISFFEKANNKLGIAECYNGIAALYVGKKDYEQAIDYHEKALKIRHDLGLKVEESMSLGNIGIVKMRQKKYKEALAFHYLSLKIIEKLNDAARMAFIYNDLGATYLADKQPLKAIPFLQKSIEIRTKIHETVELPYTLNYLGEAFEQAGQKQKAEYYIKEANHLAIQLHNTKQIKESYESISQFYARNKQTDSAYAYSIKFINYKDSVESADNLKAMDQLMVKFETEKKEQQIKLLNQQTTIDKLSINKQRTAIFIIITLFLLSSIVGFLLYNRNKLKQRALLQEQLLIQQDALTKAVIEAEEHERKRIGSDLHDGVGQLFSTVKLNLTVYLNALR
jgi:two-component system NarL family sensor kinase